jgi:hypothetical protein
VIGGADRPAVTIGARLAITIGVLMVLIGVLVAVTR